MKTIIAGSRVLIDYSKVVHAVENCGWTITEVVSGTASGPDKLGERWALENNIPIARFPADWNQYGKGAGFIRNQEMVDYAEAAIFLHDGHSSGTADCIRRAKKKGLEIVVYTYD